MKMNTAKFKDPAFLEKVHKVAKYCERLFMLLTAPQRQMKSETELCIEYLQDEET